MGNGMNKVLPGLYIGNFRDARDKTQLQQNKITHILSIHDNAKPIFAEKTYLCISAYDNAEQDILQFIPQCNDFIHRARINGGNVLVHCLAGMSRSVTITAAYVMTVTSYGWRDSLNAIRGARHMANPNFGFQRQLLRFQHEKLPQERERLEKLFTSSPYDDEAECKMLLKIYQQWVVTGDKPTTDYPLPYNAYKSQKPAAEPENAAKTTDDKSQKDCAQGDTDAPCAEEPSRTLTFIDKADEKLIDQLFASTLSSVARRPAKTKKKKAESEKSEDVMNNQFKDIKLTDNKCESPDASQESTSGDGSKINSVTVDDLFHQ